MLAVDDQRSLLGITGHSIQSWHWMGMCESVSDSPESICNPRSRRPSDPWTKASQLFADKSQDTGSPKTGETIKANWEASNNKQWVNDPVNCYSLGTLMISHRVPCLPTSKLYVRQKISIPWSQHSVRFTNIHEHCVSRPWALKNCPNPWDSRVIRETWRVWNDSKHCLTAAAVYRCVLWAILHWIPRLAKVNVEKSIFYTIILIQLACCSILYTTFMILTMRLCTA